MTNNKMTARVALTYVIDNCTMPDEVRAKLVAMLDAAEKKAAAPRKPSAKAIENAAAANVLRSFLTEEPMSIDAIMAGCSDLEGFSSHRIAAVAGKLVTDGIAKREVVKGKVHYSLNN